MKNVDYRAWKDFSLMQGSKRNPKPPSLRQFIIDLDFVLWKQLLLTFEIVLKIGFAVKWIVHSKILSSKTQSQISFSIPHIWTGVVDAKFISFFLFIYDFFFCFFVSFFNEEDISYSSFNR